MRDILFRGKTYPYMKWEYGWYVKREKPAEYEDDGLDAWHLLITDSGYCVDVDPESVTEYTGLVDANGKKIFEGDILQFGERRLCVWWNGEAFQWQAKQCSGYDVIAYENGITEWTNIDLGWIYAELPILGKMTTEVIGNIYDNPELLNWEE